MNTLILKISMGFLTISAEATAIVDTNSPDNYHPSPVYVYPTPSVPTPAPTTTNPPLSPHGVPGENEVEIFPQPNTQNTSPNPSSSPIPGKP